MPLKEMNNRYGTQNHIELFNNFNNRFAMNSNKASALQRNQAQMR